MESSKVAQKVVRQAAEVAKTVVANAAETAAEVVNKDHESTVEAMVVALERVFKESDSKDPEQMKILIRRVPILCVNIEEMQKNIEKINGNITWLVRLIIGGVVLALLTMLFKS